MIAICGTHSQWKLWQDSDVLDIMAGAVAPTILRELKRTSDTAQLNCLGSTGTNLYYCTNYTSGKLKFP